jgi:hypothetical protein
MPSLTLHMYGLLDSARGGSASHPLGDGPAENPPKIKGPRLAFRTRSLEGTYLHMGPFFAASRDESDWQGPGSMGSGLLLGQEPGE